MKVDGTGIYKQMTTETSRFLNQHTTYKERQMIALEHGFSTTLIDKILNGKRNYTPENSMVVIALFQKAINNKNKQ